MRVMVFFDLPQDTAAQRRCYRQFRAFLIKEGFVMMQESLYVRFAVNTPYANMVIDRVRKNRPTQGLVQALKITEKQFAGIEYITGEAPADVSLDVLEEVIVL